MAIFWITVALVVALLVGAPVAVAIGVSGLVGILLAGMPIQYLAQTAYSAVDSFTIIAVPMFILAGTLMEQGKLTERLIAFSRALVGPSPGGLGTVTVVACTLFAAISGSGPATTAAIGSIMIPAMVRDGYSPNFASGLSASAGGIGVVIPPSIPMIIYGVTAETSITGLFVAGVIPGLVLAGALYATSRIISTRKGYRSGDAGQRNWRRVLETASHGKWALLAPVVILGGIYLGIFTVTEASVVAVVYALFVGTVLHRSLDAEKIFACLLSAAKTSGTVLLVLTTGIVFGRILALYEVPQIVSEWMTETITNPSLLILAIIAMLIFVGMWMETITQIVVLTPLLLPAAQSAGIDPLQFGIMFVIACEIGFQTPPLGVNLFVASEIAQCKVEDVARGVLPFCAAAIAVLLLIAFVPELSLWLPRTLGYIN